MDTVPVAPTVRRELPPLMVGGVIMLVGPIMWLFRVSIAWAARMAPMT